MTITIPQVREYMTAFLFRYSDGAIWHNAIQNDRLQMAIEMLEDQHEGLEAMNEDAKQIKEKIL